MSKEKSPAFLFYASDYLSDENVTLMTLEDEGCYIRLLAYCWREGSIPADPAMLASLCKGRTPSAAVLSCFQPSQNGDAFAMRLLHKRLEIEREKRAQKALIRSNSGRKGALHRWGTKRVNSKRILLPMAKNSISIAIANESERLFGVFYSSYPRKENPKKALEAFLKSSIDEILLQNILVWLESAKKSEQWQDKAKIPHPTTFLNQRRWEGDPPPPSNPSLFTRPTYDIHSRNVEAVNRFAAKSTGGPDE